MGMDLNKLMQQAQQMQEDMQKAQEEMANETVEGTAGGGAVTVKATGTGKIIEIKIKKEAIDPEDPETLEDLVARRGQLGAAGGGGAREVEAEPRRARRPRLARPRASEAVRPRPRRRRRRLELGCGSRRLLRAAGHEVRTPDLELRDAGDDSRGPRAAGRRRVRRPERRRARRPLVRRPADRRRGRPRTRSGLRASSISTRSRRRDGDSGVVGAPRPRLVHDLARARRAHPADPAGVRRRGPKRLRAAARPPDDDAASLLADPVASDRRRRVACLERTCCARGPDSGRVAERIRDDARLGLPRARHEAHGDAHRAARARRAAVDCAK